MTYGVALIVRASGFGLKQKLMPRLLQLICIHEILITIMLFHFINNYKCESYNVSCSIELDKMTLHGLRKTRAEIDRGMQL